MEASVYVDTSSEAELLSEAQLMLRQASRRLAELERLAAQTIAAEQAKQSASATAAADHLAEHRRLAGLTEPDKEHG